MSNDQDKRQDGVDTGNDGWTLDEAQAVQAADPTSLTTTTWTVQADPPADSAAGGGTEEDAGGSTEDPGADNTEPDSAEPDSGPAGTTGSGNSTSNRAATGWQPSGSPPTPVRDSSAASSTASSTASGAGSAAGSAAQTRVSPRRDQDTGPEPAAALTADRLLAPSDRPPVGGWRRWLHAATLGYVNVGDSRKVRLRRALEHRIGARLGDQTRYVPVLSRKGGVGKTTVTTLLGMTLADIREDRVIAMDANPDRGTLSDRSPGRTDYTARQLVQDRFSVGSFVQLSNYVARDGSRLDILASETDPTVAQAFDEVDYRAVTEVLGRYYSIVLTDSGTGMVHSVMQGTLEKADTVVLVSGGSVDEARLASETLSWLEAHGRRDLVEKAVVVINLSSGGGNQVDVSQIEEHFTSRVRAVVKIPYDRHLAEGARINMAELRPATRAAAVELAALVADELHA